MHLICAPESPFVFSRLFLVFAVGTPISERPPHRSVQAGFPHRLLPRVFDGKAHTRPGMQDLGLGEKFVGQFRHPRP